MTNDEYRAVKPFRGELHAVMRRQFAECSDSSFRLDAENHFERQPDSYLRFFFRPK